MSYKILVIDDDIKILRLIKNVLDMSHYNVTIRQEISEINVCDFIGYDLILLDVMMPISGLDICQAIREKTDTPILFITAKDMEDDIITGINMGADDYITKPFSMSELLARVKMHLRREERIKGKKDKIVFKDIFIDLYSQQVYVKNNLVQLTKREYEIVHLMASNPGRVFTIEDIYERVYPTESDALFRSISEYIYKIRIKFRNFNVNPIVTIWGVGYKWEKEGISTH